MISADTHRGPFSASRSAWLIGMALSGLALFGLTGCNMFSEVASAPAADQVAPAVTVQNAGDIKYYPSERTAEAWPGILQEGFLRDSQPLLP